VLAREAVKLKKDSIVLKPLKSYTCGTQGRAKKWKGELALWSTKPK
jgi:hypothetical protein